MLIPWSVTPGENWEGLWGVRGLKDMVAAIEIKWRDEFLDGGDGRRKRWSDAVEASEDGQKTNADRAGKSSSDCGRKSSRSRSSNRSRSSGGDGRRR